MRVGEKEVSERAAIVAAYADLFSREQLDALRSAEQQAEGDEARASLPPAQGVRGRGCRPGALGAPGRSSRTRSSPSGSRSRARRSRSGRHRPGSRSCRRTRDREELGDVNGDASAGFNEGRRELMGAENELAAELSGTVDPIERNEEEKGISIRALAEQPASGKRRERRWRTASSGTAGSSACSAPSAKPIPASYHMAYMRRLSPLEETYTKERSVEVCMDTLSKLGFDLANEASIRLDLDDRPQKSPRACVIASDAPERRPPDHESAGRAPRLPGVPARGRARPPLRGLRSRPSVHVPQPVARPRADRDLLVHPRGDLPRARLARRVLRPLGRRGDDQRRGHDLPRGPALSALRGEARLRARVLGPLRRGRRHSGRLLRAPRRGDRCPLPPRCIPRGHGRGLLLGRLPARLDPLRAAARAPGRRRSGPSGGAHRRPASGCARSSARGRARRARRSPLASASIRSTPHRSSPSFRRRVRACLRLPSTGSIGTTS